MELAPIVIFTFNRIDHTKKTLSALAKNELASQSELYIFSDGPRNLEEKIKVDEVRRYLESIEGFKNITIIKAETNKGLAKSVIDGVTEIINKYGRVIVLEDDLITSPKFITYMNKALELYDKRRDIWSISGYTPNIDIPTGYSDSVYLIRRGASWGWATWKDRWVLNDWQISDYKEFKRNKDQVKKFNIAGSDMAPMLEDQMKGRINSWAIRWGYNQYRHDKWTVYPISSFVNNIGNDLSGTHTAATTKYAVELSNNDIDLNCNIKINDEICMSFKKFYDLNYIGYINIIIKKIGLYKPARKLRNKLIMSLRRDGLC